VPRTPRLGAGTPPLHVGRPMIEHCNPKYDEDWQPNHWGHIDNMLLWDKETGWCESDNPIHE
jgi:hypothetical protein